MATLQDDLLGVAHVLLDASLELEKGLEQATLRRAVSTAYYALFHLMIHEATRNWAIIEQRGALGRMFNHRPMKNACTDKIGEINGLLKANPPAEEREIAEAIRTVAETFVNMQEYRERADYDTAARWTDTDIAERLDSVSEAFKRWEAVRETRQAQDFLLSLFVAKRR